MEIRTYKDEDCPDYVRACEALEDATLSDGLSDYIVRVIDVLIPIFNKRLPSWHFVAHSKPASIEVYKHFVQCTAPQLLSMAFYAELTTDYVEAVGVDVRFCKQGRCALSGWNPLTNHRIIATGEVSELPILLEQLLHAFNESFAEIQGYCFPVLSQAPEIKSALIFSSYYYLYYDSTGMMITSYENMPFKLTADENPVVDILSLVSLSHEVSDEVGIVNEQADYVSRRYEANRAVGSVTVPYITKYLREQYRKQFAGVKGSVDHLKWIEKQFKKDFNVTVN